VKGSPENPFTMGECVERFMTWAGVAVRPIPRERLERFVEMVENLADVKDAGERAPLLA